MEEEDLRKKTISELKMLLQEKGLKTAGKKEELMARLMGSEAVDINQTSESNTSKSEGTDDQSDDNDTIFAVESGKRRSLSGKNIPTEERSDNEKSAGEVSVSMSPKDDSNPAETGMFDPKSKDLSKMTEDERMKLRAKRFNVPLKISQQKKAGIKSPRKDNPRNKDIGKGVRLTPEEKSKRRLENLIKRKGVEGGVPLDDQEREKRQKRLERFGKK